MTNILKFIKKIEENINNSKKLINVITLMILISLILPVSNLLGYVVPYSYYFSPICVLFSIYHMKSKSNEVIIFKRFIQISLLILLYVFIVTPFTSLANINKISFPRELLQYIIKFLFLISFYYISSLNNFSEDKFIKHFILVLNIGMLIGLLQWIPWFGRESLVRLYPFKDGISQLEQLKRPFYLIRTNGFAQHATANGGIATFSISVAISYLKSIKLSSIKTKIPAILLIVFSIINLFASQARSGIIVTIIMCFVFYFLDIKRRKILDNKKVFWGLLIIIVLSIFALYILKNPFISRMVYRFSDLIKNKGGARISLQAKYFISKMDIFDYLFGLSKSFVNNSDISYGIEIEPLYIFVTYGIFGCLLHYFLPFILLVYFYNNINESSKTSMFFSMASFATLLGYLIFSFGYFFFREIRIGLFTWILMGVSIGVIERNKRINK